MSKELFDVIRRIKGKALNADDVHAVNAVLHPSAPTTGRRTSQKGIDLIHSFEQLRLTAYKDPGSSSGLPITNGWGTTVGENMRAIKLGEVWDKAKADRLFARDLACFEMEVERLTGGVTTQNQFDALVSFGYNIGTGQGGLASSTLLRLHKDGDYAGAAAQFARWNKNDGRVLNGLTRRRAAEAALYRSA